MLKHALEMIRFLILTPLFDTTSLFMLKYNTMIKASAHEAKIKKVDAYVGVYKAKLNYTDGIEGIEFCMAQVNIERQEDILQRLFFF